MTEHAPSGMSSKDLTLSGESLEDAARYKHAVEVSVLAWANEDEKKALGPKLYRNLLAMNRPI